MALTSIIGKVVGPLSSRTEFSAGSATWTNTDAPYTFAVGGIPFNVVPKDDNPFQRVTAQFRKQQFDNAANPGEQSIDGYWLRGQFSFHQGAGIKYNDATPDTEFRFRDAVNVAVHSPGEAKLHAHWSTLFFESFQGDGSKWASGYDGGTTGYMWYKAIADSKLYRADMNATNVLESSVTITDFAPDTNVNGHCYYSNAATIYTSSTHTSIYTTPSNVTNIWWAKDRLFFVDAVGRWFAEAATPSAPPVALVAGDAFWAGIGVADGWRLADAPAAVYLCNRRIIYSVTLDSTGAVPTVSAPRVVAQLPEHEEIRAMKHYLGKLVLVTSRGVRVCETNDNGLIELGPWSVLFKSSKCVDISAQDDHVTFSGTRPEDAHEMIFQLDLGEQHTDGTYAFTRAPDVLNTGATKVGLTYFVDGPTFRDGTFAWDDAGNIVHRGLLRDFETGWIQTGYIRLGTMEPKLWHSVRVKLTGTEGSVTVAIIRAGDSEETLTTLNATGFIDQDIKLNLPGPEEFIALKFYLNGGATLGSTPTLLGYQVRALPAPTRSRMIQVPLLCYDQETFENGVKRGRDGWAWARLSALEEMERNAGEIIFQDFRTGEQGLAFIEEVSFTNTTAPKGNNGSGFGGIVTVTLRELST